jgi:dTDP-4-dehydrorhamnose reductase
MRILILGGSGMLGHMLLKTLQPCHDARVTLRHSLEHYRQWPLFRAANSFGDVDVRSPASLVQAISQFRPEAVVNCIGLVKQQGHADDVLENLEINAAAPHRIAKLCRNAESRLIHISTDGVFSGRRGMYTEEDIADAEDLQGRAKHLGELDEPHCMTLRTSIVGRELARRSGLLEWFLAQNRPVKGFKRAVFSGLTTIELSRAIEMLLTKFPKACGLYHVSSEPIDKFTLLHLFRDHFGVKIDILRDEEIVIDRSLNSSRFRREFDYRPPPWPVMVKDL